VAFLGRKTMPHRVLVVDDDPAIHALAKESLTNWFTQCIGAFDGESGVRMASERKPDAILLDMNMLGLNGYEVCRQLKSNTVTQKIPIIFLTSRTACSDKVLGMEMGAADYITKPFDPDELRVRVRSALRSRDSLRMAETRIVTDQLTGLLNSAYLQRRIEADVSAARRSGKALACVLAAVEQWDQPFDSLGEAGRDEFIRTAADGIVASLRKEDVTCRWDDRTFAVLAFISDRPKAMELGRRIQRAIVDAGYMCGPTSMQAVVSVGISLARFSSGAPLLKEAENALQDARINAQGKIKFGAELRVADWTTSGRQKTDLPEPIQ
jgi:two-component system, cell cycle response regulator